MESGKQVICVCLVGPGYGRVWLIRWGAYRIPVVLLWRIGAEHLCVEDGGDASETADRKRVELHGCVSAADDIGLRDRLD